MSKTGYIVLGAAGAAALFFCYRSGRHQQKFTGIDAVRAGAAKYIDRFADLISPTCCTKCQQKAQAAAAGAAGTAAAASSSSAADGVPLDGTDTSTAAPQVTLSCGA